MNLTALDKTGSAFDERKVTSSLIYVSIDYSLLLFMKLLVLASESQKEYSVPRGHLHQIVALKYEPT
jgi:hypothetical protein